MMDLTMDYVLLGSDKGAERISPDKFLVLNPETLTGYRPPRTVSQLISSTGEKNTLISQDPAFRPAAVGDAALGIRAAEMCS